MLNTRMLKTSIIVRSRANRVIYVYTSLSEYYLRNNLKPLDARVVGTQMVVEFSDKTRATIGAM